MEIADVGRVYRRIILGPKDFTGVELIRKSFEEVHAGSADLIAIALSVVHFLLVKFHGPGFHQSFVKVLGN